MSELAYQAGGQAGQVALVALTVWTPAGWLGTALTALKVTQFAGGVGQALDAGGQGRTADMWSQLTQTAVTAVIQAGPCVVGKVAGDFAGSAAQWGAGWVTRGIAVATGVNAGIQGIQQIASGDQVGGMLTVAQGAADIFSAFRSCFPAGTELKTDEGFKAVETITFGGPVAIAARGGTEWAVGIQADSASVCAWHRW